VPKTFQARTTQPIKVGFACIGVAAITRVSDHTSHEELDDIFDPLCAPDLFYISGPVWIQFEVIGRNGLFQRTLFRDFQICFLGETVELDLTTHPQVAKTQSMGVTDIAPLVALAHIGKRSDSKANTPLGCQIDILVSCGVESVDNLAIDFIRDSVEEKPQLDRLTCTEYGVGGVFFLLAAAAFAASPPE
jgi:hypothetical protein